MTRAEAYAKYAKLFPRFNGSTVEPGRLHRWFTVTQDDNGDTWHEAARDTLTEACEDMEVEAEDERSWWPRLVVDLDSDRVYVPRARVSVTVPGLTDEG